MLPDRTGMYVTSVALLFGGACAINTWTLRHLMRRMTKNPLTKANLLMLTRKPVGQWTAADYALWRRMDAEARLNEEKTFLYESLRDQFQPRRGAT